MAMFQKSVINDFIEELDDKAIEVAYSFIEIYKKQKETILSMKEEEYQTQFLNDIFVDVLGYTLKPKENFNLVREKKKQTDSKKADGAILNEAQDVIGIIELKSSKLKDMSTIENQAFNYKNNFPTCKYIITSNFEKLRFYIDYSNEFEEFNLFDMTKEDFKLFYLLLSKQNLFNNIPLKLKEETKVKEEDISKDVYKDYSSFKMKVFNNLVINNPNYDKLLLFKKSQKLLDRFLFVLFGEDKTLLPPNTITKYEVNWENTKKMGLSNSLYSHYQQLFIHLDKGFKNDDYEIHAYNGGLFIYDDILDNPNIIIEDEVLKDDILKLSAYDFNTEVDVNILGHIFEHSLNEIEEISAELEGITVDTKKTKRKKDGVFYTPKYITKYIVENTIGTLCKEKKKDLDIEIIDYAIFEKNKTTKGKFTQKAKDLYDKLDSYKDYLLGLKIVDPACGSGAFLNQALEFLINEHTELDGLTSQLTGDHLGLFNIRKSILENNLYGVDINEESIEIAKLSLWLRTAEKGRKLSVLSNNIKCGNSLIDDPEVAGDKAFKWEDEFPDVFAKGGFDVVIGNPPYVRVQTIKDSIQKESIELEKEYNSATRRYDLFVLFMEKSFKLVNYNGVVNFILPHKFLVADFGFGIRKFLKEKSFINKLIHFGHEIVFETASTYTCIVQLIKNSKEFSYAHINPEQLLNDFEFSKMKIVNLTNEKWELHDSKTGDLISKIRKHPKKLKDVLHGIYQGIKNTSDKIFMMRGNITNGIYYGYSDELSEKVEIEAEIMKPVAKGKDIKRYRDLNVNYHVIYPHYFNGKKTVTYEEDELKSKFPKAYEYLLKFKSFLTMKKIKFKTNPRYWYGLHRSREIDIFSNKKIVTATIQNYPHFSIDNTKTLTDAGGYALVIDRELDLTMDKLLPILNSKLMWFFIKNTSSVYRGGYFAFNTTFLNPFPLAELPLNMDHFVEKTKVMLNLNKTCQSKTSKFTNFIKKEYDLEKLNKKIDSFFELSFDDFIKELKKIAKLKPVSAKEKMDLNDYWVEMFEEFKKEVLTLKSEIDKTDKAIDQMVYELYELTEEDIKIIEESS